MKKIITAILLSAMLLSTLVCFSACNSSDDTPLTPYIGENGNWWIGDSDTNIAATGPKGDKGEDGTTYVAPTFRLNAATGNYEVSYDEGATWAAIEKYDPNGDQPTDAPADKPSNQPSGEPEEIKTYEYPLENVAIVDGTVAYSKDHVYKLYNETKLAFINLEELDYDIVSFDIADDHPEPWVGFAFLTKMPDLNEKVSYAEGYSTFKFTYYDCTADIPSDAKYLVFYYSTTDDMNYLPSKITFKTGKTLPETLQDNTLDAYDLPMEYLVAEKAVIKYYATGNDKNKFMVDGTNRVALINITNTVFNTVTLTPANRDDKWMGYAFLTDMPEIGDAVSYATGYNTFKDYEGEFEIPEDAKYLAIYYMDSEDELYYPAGIKFEK